MNILAVYQEISLSVLQHTCKHASHDYLARWALWQGNSFSISIKILTSHDCENKITEEKWLLNRMLQCVGKCCACVLSGCTARLLRAPLSISTHQLQLCQAAGVGRYITQFSVFNESHKPEKSLFFTFRRVEGLRFFVFLPWGSTIFLIKCSNIHLFVNLYFMLK